ncbi:unnamed protein product [Paramecium sonneborni]|uniref:Uncharacterized protein n=1 Tax=Paramecium sonneborni TaxID=65129 RepID=A0A8S1QSA8_9CILI|nr:unnamed protein product [Paramecium sonneborni]
MRNQPLQKLFHKKMYKRVFLFKNPAQQYVQAKNPKLQISSRQRNIKQYF